MKQAKNIINCIVFFFKEVIMNMFLAYLIPLINILIILFVNKETNSNNVLIMNVINILIATNACYMASISSYYRIKEKYNKCAGYIKTFGIVISAVAFAISTYELQINNFNIPFNVYNVSAIISSALCIILTVFSKLESLEIDKRVEKSEMEKVKELIVNSEQKETFDIDGQKFEV